MKKQRNRSAPAGARKSRSRRDSRLLAREKGGGRMKENILNSKNGSGKAEVNNGKNNLNRGGFLERRAWNAAAVLMKKEGRNMTAVKEAHSHGGSRILLPRGKWRGQGKRLIIRLAPPRAGRQIGRTLKIMNRVIPVTSHGDGSEEVFFRVKISKGKPEREP